MATLSQLERCANSVAKRLREEEGLSAKDALSRAYAICTRSLQRSGYLKKGTNKPTKKGVKRAEELSKERGAKTRKREFEKLTRESRKEVDTSRLDKLMAKYAKKSSSRTRKTKTKTKTGARKKSKARPASGSLNRIDALLRGSASRSSSTELSERLHPLREAMSEVFACDTAWGDCVEERPSSGHCFLAAMVVQDLFGGCIVQGDVGPVPHYWNRVGEIEVDITGDQFEQPEVQVKRGKLRPSLKVFARDPGQPLRRWCNDGTACNEGVIMRYGTFKRRLLSSLRARGLRDMAERLEAAE